MTKTKIITLLFLFFILSAAHAQNTAIGQWKAHLPFNKARLLTQSDTKIYCGVEDGLFIYSKTDNSFETITKVNGLSDIQLSALNYYPAKDILLVGYENGNMDIFQGNKVYNVADIKRKNILGSKRINNILFFDNYAYLSCAFGIVVLNLDKKEIKDSYYLSLFGNANAIYDLATDGTNLYAASDSGVFSANIFDPNINYFGNWNTIRLDTIPSEVCDHITWFKNKLYIAFHLTGDYSAIFNYDNGSWINTLIGSQALHTIQIANDQFILTSSNDVKVCKFIDGSLQKTSDFNPPTFTSMRDAILDNSNILWVADEIKGLFKAISNSSYEFFIPDGPHSKLAAGMQILNNQLWVGHSTTGAKWDNSYSGDGFSTFVDDKWTTYDKTNLTSPIVNLDTVYDFMSLAIDPRNSNHIFLGSRGAGVLEFERGVGIKNYYNEANSSLQSAQGNSGSCQLGGMAFDKDYNLWMANSTTAAPMSELKTDGTWQSFSFPGVFGAPPFLGEFFIDSYGQKWMDNNGGGVLVFDDSFTLGPRKYNFLNSDSGGLPSNDIRAMVEDREGQVWVGTAKGVAVFYNPASVLALPAATAQQILLKQDNTFQYLLATEEVTSIAIDGANRKWFGTTNAGVFLMSADGTQQILHFTVENSPLLSNSIACMAINQKTGEVFIGTNRGIISYKSDAIEGDDKCNDTYVYPNPVYHEYEGPISIKGLMANGNVKITDISGTLIYETTALGGQAIWNGKNFKGEKAHTGVYLVFCSDEEGKNTCITKLLLFN
ncbi:MAG TPA: two-component regulator propeller domain-containing protein [Bacteroidia bacterium]|nr:two-component regulator propeller domain-containing protein [Bacteroidia bacterium]